MATKAQTLKKIQNWIVTCTGLSNNKVIFAYQNKALPELPYIEIVTTDEKKIGDEDDEISLNNGTVKFIKVRELYLTIHAYGSNALDLLKIVNDKNSTYQAIRNFFGDICINRVTDPKDIPLLENNKYIGHAYMEMFVQYQEEVIEEVGYFDNIPNFIMQS